MSERRISFHDLSAMDEAARSRLLVRSEADLGDFIAKVQPIIDRVRAEGDAALARFAREFDRADLDAERIRATGEEFDRAFAELEPEVLESIEYAAHGIREFHQRQKPEPMWMHEVRPGVFAGEKTEPIPSVALYVPRGKGAFPSVALMTAIPAVVAGVPEIALITPPRPDGGVDAATLVAARIAGVENVYKCGGAQGVAAVAYGTETVPKCAKIVGPGSPWVVAAKRVLAGVIDPGLPAGPSEAIILADATADGAIAALDLIVESEHGPDSSAFLVTDSRAVAEAAMAAIPRYWAQMGEQRVGFSSTVLCGPRGGIVLAPDFDAAIAFVNAYAPEHLEIVADEPMAYLGRIRNAGEVLLGANTPVPLGNFVLGPNAVLPTSGAARTHSPLSVYDFMKRISIGQVTAAAYPELARHAERLARYEGFDGHANAVSETRTRVMAGKA
jgi:histidinol dehydrogenase